MPAGYSQGIPLSTANLKLRNDEDVQGLLTYCKFSWKAVVLKLIEDR